MASGAAAAPTLPPLRRTPSSCGKPTSTARPGRSAAASPCHASMSWSRRGSSGRRRGFSGLATGTSCVDHAAALEDPPDMIHSEVIEQVPVVGDVTNDQVRLLADFKRTDAIAATEGGGGVEGQ